MAANVGRKGLVGLFKQGNNVGNGREDLQVLTTLNFQDGMKFPRLLDRLDWPL